MPATEDDFDALPEPLKKALMDDAFERLATGKAGPVPTEIQKIYRIAIIKLQHQSMLLDTDISDFLP